MSEPFATRHPVVLFSLLAVLIGGLHVLTVIFYPTPAFGHYPAQPVSLRVFTTPPEPGCAWPGDTAGPNRESGIDTHPLEKPPRLRSSYLPVLSDLSSVPTSLHPCSPVAFSEALCTRCHLKQTFQPGISPFPTPKALRHP